MKFFLLTESFPSLSPIHFFCSPSLSLSPTHWHLSYSYSLSPIHHFCLPSLNLSPSPTLSPPSLIIQQCPKTSAGSLFRIWRLLLPRISSISLVCVVPVTQTPSHFLPPLTQLTPSQAAQGSILSTAQNLEQSLSRPRHSKHSYREPNSKTPTSSSKKNPAKTTLRNRRTWRQSML